MRLGNTKHLFLWTPLTTRQELKSLFKEYHRDSAAHLKINSTTISQLKDEDKP